MAGGDFRIGVQPGFGGLMQDLGRHLVGEAGKKTPPVLPQPPPATAVGEPDNGHILPAVLTLASPLPVQAFEADRRLRSLAEFQQAFVDFDEPAEPRHSASTLGRKAPESARRGSDPAERDTLPLGDATPLRRDAAPLQLDISAPRAAASGTRDHPPARAHRQSATPTTLAPAANAQATQGPAWGQPTLFMCAMTVAALVGGWLAMRLL